MSIPPPDIPALQATACRELARASLMGFDASTSDVAELAEHIKESINDWIENNMLTQPPEDADDLPF